MTTILIGDIGGTNARLELGTLTGDSYSPIRNETLPTKNYKCFVPLLKDFIKDQTPRVAILAVAGIAEGSSARFVNQPWDPIFCNSADAQRELGIERLVFLNDFEAAGYGCLALAAGKFAQLNEVVQPVENARKVIMGPGTGLGEALLAWTGSKYLCWPGEGGHSDFTPHTQEDWEFAQFMMHLVQTSAEYEKFRPCEGVSFEVCCAGVGAFHIYDFFRSKFPELASAEFDAIWESEPNARTKHMMEFGFSGRDELCVKSVHLWLKVVAYECGNLIAKNLPVGGLYIMGGLVSKNFDSIIRHKEVFLKALYTKPKHIQDIMNRVPIYIVNHDDVGMDGALVYSKNAVRELV